jgi:two-component system, OmpR family, KDP operon response regulator KdpE
MTADVLLVVDDEPQIRRVVRNSLAQESTRIIEAATGRDAIDLAAAERPSLIVLDLGLPDVSGLEVCREIRAWSSAPIIVLSARHSDQEKVAASCKPACARSSAARGLLPPRARRPSSPWASS